MGVRRGGLGGKWGGSEAGWVRVEMGREGGGVG